MDQPGNAADRLKQADEAAIRQAMLSMLLMLGFVGLGFALAAYGAYHVWRSGDAPATTSPADTPASTDSPPKTDSTPSIPTGPVPVELSAEVAQQIELLIEQLGATEYRTRQRASKALGEYGERARTALQRAAQSSDAEVRERARNLLADLDRARGGK